MRASDEQQSRRVTLAEFWRDTALGMAEEAVSGAAEMSRAAGREVSCRKGCGACCRQLATVSPAEAWALLDVIEGMEGSERASLLERFAAAEERLRGVGLLETLLNLDDPALDDWAHYELARKYFGLGLACPFLVDEACSIHAARPARCREYLVTSPAELCADPFAGDGDAAVVERVATGAEVSEAMIGLCAQVTGTEARMIPVSLILAWAQRFGGERDQKLEESKLRGLLELHLIIR